MIAASNSGMIEKGRTENIFFISKILTGKHVAFNKN